MYLDSLKELFSSPKERTFTDRTEILSLLNEALTLFHEKPEISQVFLIHGIGGVGKTRLVNEFIKMLHPEPVIYVSFEIEKRNEIINNLYQIRKSINSSCPFFDFALLRYWEQTNPSALNDDFMLLFQKGFFIDMLDFASEIVGCSSSYLQSTGVIPAIPSPGSIIDFVNNIYRKLPKLLHNDIFKTISNTSADELAVKLPTLLGIEIGRLIEKNSILHPVFVFDSYQESQPYSESEEWLLHLIKAAGKGLFIVTSREPLHWKVNQPYFTMHHLECYPEKEAKKLLEETITDRPDLVDIIIESTQCVPIYIDLALNVYERERDAVGDYLVKKALFRDRHMLVNQFISHLKPSWQTAVINLAIIRVFDFNIFSYLSKQRMIDCAPYEYDEIIKSNLFNYVSKSKNSNLVKLHDVFCRDIYAYRSVSESYAILKTYLEYICHRRDIIISENNGATLVALFQNLIFLFTSIESRLGQEGNLQLETDVIENLLDIFFSLVSNRVRFVPPSYENVRTEIMRKVCQFICAKTYEKDNTLKTIENLKNIGDTTCFGKHKISYESILYYTQALAGNYDELERWIDSVDSVLNEQMKGEWFYNRIKIYQADCDVLRGRFKTAEMELLLLENNYYLSTEDYYTIYRTIGHIQRFNFQLQDAYNTYSKLLKMYGHNTVFREYLVANLIETQCFFPNKDFIHWAKRVLDSMATPYNVKNKGKVLYGLAIANIVKRNYKSAQKSIDECIRINREDGYQSGELFAYVAQAYLDYARNKKISEKTHNNIERLFLQNGAYTFFRLQLAIMDGDAIKVNNIRSEYEWIDFESAEKECRHFLSQLSNK